MTIQTFLKRVARFALITSMLATASSCSLDSLDSSEVEELISELTGSWDWQESSSGNGSDPNGDPNSVSTPNDNDQREHTYTETGGYTTTQKNAEGEVLSSESGTWTLDENELTIKFGEFETTYDIEIVDGRLTRTRVANEDGFEYWTRDRWVKRGTE